MFEKSILVVYINVDGYSSKLVLDTVQSIQGYLNKQFYDDNCLTIIVVPVRNQPTKIELLNAKYPDWEAFQNDIETLKEKIQTQIENLK